MKKMMLLAALLAMLVVAAVPAIAQVTQTNDLEGEAADLEQSSEVTGGGDNSAQCVGDLLQGNTGNAQNVSGTIAYASTDPSATGNATIEMSPEFEEDFVSCEQPISQAAAAG